MKKELIFVISCMCSGGAERVITLLSSGAVRRGYSVSLLITGQRLEDAELSEVDPAVKVVSVADSVDAKKYMRASLIGFFAGAEGKLTQLFTGKRSDSSRMHRYLSENYARVMFMRSFFRDRPGSTVIAFLYDSIFLSLFSVGKDNRLIISERGDPEQTTSETTRAFIRSGFKRADGFVFQSPSVAEWYENNTGIKGEVIFNPVKSELPEIFYGERKKTAVNFCRISSQKNLVMLIDAFAIFHAEFPEYKLHIYGDAVGNDAEGYLDKVNGEIKKHSLEECVCISPARRDIHSAVYDCAMFVSSSDYEGMSNSMLEAMAMGMPCVCTDCPAGGARAVISDGENGLLTPVGDAHALAAAMIKIAANPDFAEALGRNAANIREIQSEDKIIEKWMEIANG